MTDFVSPVVNVKLQLGGESSGCGRARCFPQDRPAVGAQRSVRLQKVSQAE